MLGGKEGGGGREREREGGSDEAASRDARLYSKHEREEEAARCLTPR